MALIAQTNASLTLTSIQTNDFGGYRVVVANGWGSVTNSIPLLCLDHQPVPVPHTVQRFAAGGVRFNGAELVATDKDADSDSLTVAGVAASSSAGGTVELRGNWIYYLPPAGYTNADTITYTVSDGHCGGTAQGVVTVQVRSDSTPSAVGRTERPGDGSLRLSFDGVPGCTYRIQYAESLSTDWHDLATQTADEFGVCEYIDWPATNGPARFYRSVWP